MCNVFPTPDPPNVCDCNCEAKFAPAQGDLAVFWRSQEALGQLLLLLSGG